MSTSLVVMRRATALPMRQGPSSLCPAAVKLEIASSVLGQYIEATGSDEERDCIDCATGTYLGVTGSGQDDNCIAWIAGKHLDVAGGRSADRLHRLSRWHIRHEDL